MNCKDVEKGIFPVDDGCQYGDVLYGYTDIEEAKNDYEELTGEELDVENCQHVNIVRSNCNGDYFSWEDQTKGIPSIINIY